MTEQIFWLAFFVMALLATLNWKRVGDATLEVHAKILPHIGIHLDTQSPRLRSLYRAAVLLGGIGVTAAGFYGWWFTVPTSLGALP